jgi:glycosyltransferase involved in cell wall biosynthesis
VTASIPASVVIITCNEERNIRDALESVKNFSDIVVVDSFSADRTVEICRQYTERVYQQEWKGFARQKQTAVDYAKEAWVLIIDADERVTPELREEIIKTIHQCPENGFYIPRKNFFLNRWIRHSGWWPDYTLRLFRKGQGRLDDREVHEKVVLQGETGYLKKPLEHHTYRTLSEYIQKMEKYSGLAAREITNRKSPSPPSVLMKITFSPPFTFLKMYLLRQGIRDGMRGFLLAILYSFYTFLKYAKVWEERTAAKK